MPKQKDLKRLVRSRMKKTGESYTTARMQLAKKKLTPPAEVVPEEGYAALGGKSDEVLRVKTGKTWRQWVRLLDAVDAARMPHRDIARHLHREHQVPGWWAQTVTVGYERIRGLREVGQRRSGEYEVSKSKTLPVPLADLFAAFQDSRRRRRWLPGVSLTVRKATPEKSIRVTWPDGTSVEAYFAAKGDEKSQIAIQHRKLAARADATRMKAYWAERLDALAEMLNPRR